MLLRSSLLALILITIPFLSSTKFIEQTQAQEKSVVMDGELLFSVKCGRCHSHFRLANHYFRGKEIENAKLAIDNDRFGHSMRDEKARRLIIDYLSELVKRN